MNRKIIRVEVDYNFDLDGSVQGAIKTLEKMEKDLTEQGYSNIELFHNRDYECSRFEVWADRLETDEEVKRRLDREKIVEKNNRRYFSECSYSYDENLQIVPVIKD